MAKSKNLIKLKNHNFFLNFKNIKTGPGFLIPRAKLTFTMLRQVFVETLILYHFDLEYNIWIEINTSGYAIG